MSIYYSEKDLTILHDDFLHTSAIDDNSIDLIVTSPPYNVDIKYNSHDDQISYEDYLDFSKVWMTQAYRFAKSSCRFCLNVPLDKNKGGQQSVCADLTVLAKEIGWKYHSTVIWNEGNISRRTAWGSWKSATAPYVIAPVEVIVILFKDQWKKVKTDKDTDITKEEFMSWTNGVWTFNGESKKRIGHPAPYPIELPKRCIKLFSFVGDTVLDPFLGSGTTLLACGENKRKGIGVDIDEGYCELARTRIINDSIISQLKIDWP